MYTRDRSTPQPDHFYVGSDSITGAAGSQIDGITTIVFRKKNNGESFSVNQFECLFSNLKRLQCLEFEVSSLKIVIKVRSLKFACLQEQYRQKVNFF